MYRITGDQLLWKRRLHCDMLSWATLDHLTHPRVYEEVRSDLSYKQMYMLLWDTIGISVSKNTYRVATNFVREKIFAD